MAEIGCAKLTTVALREVEQIDSATNTEVCLIALRMVCVFVCASV